MARNRSIAQIVLEVLKYGFKPILFVGGMHMHAEPKTEEEQQASAEHIASLTKEEGVLFQGAELTSLDSHFKKNQIGYEFVSMKGNSQYGPTAELDGINYALTFVSQTTRKK